MSSTSFTSAARAAMRANEPQHPSASEAPRHTYASSYARDYADLQRYHEYLQQHAEAHKQEKEVAKGAYESARATNNDAGNNYNILSHTRDPQGSYAERDEQYARSSSRKAYEPLRTPYAQHEEPTAVPYSARSDRDSEASSRPPNRYSSTNQESYGKPDTSHVAAKLPPPPSKMTPGTVVKPFTRPLGETPWASHDDPPPSQRGSTHAQPPPSVPALALHKVTAAAYEPYSADKDALAREEHAHLREPSNAWDRARDPEDDREERQREREREREHVDEEDTYRAREAEHRRRVAAYEEEERRAGAPRYDDELEREDRYGAHPNRDHEREHGYDSDRDSRAPGPSTAWREHDADRRDYATPRDDRSRRDDYYQDDREDEVSRPMQDLRMGGGGGGSGRGRYEESRGDSERERGRYRDDRDDAHYRRDDRGRSPPRQYPGDSQRQAPDSHHRRDSSASTYPASSSSYSDPDLTLRERQKLAARAEAAAHYGHTPAGRFSGRKDPNSHTPIFVPVAAAAPSSDGRTAKKMVPNYGDYVERSNRSPSHRAGPGPYDPSAAGARTTKSISRYGHLDSGFSIGGGGGGEVERPQVYQGPQDGREEVSRRGVARTGVSSPSIYERNPILQDSPNYEPRIGTFRQQERLSSEHAASGGGGGSSVSDYPRHEHWSSAVSHRRSSGLTHPSVESAHLEASKPPRRNAELQAASPWSSRRDASVLGGHATDRGVRIVGDQSHRSSDIFGTAAASQMAPQSTGPGGRDEPVPPSTGGVRRSPHRNAGQDLLAARNLIYDQRPQAGYFDREPEEEAGAASGAAGTPYRTGGGAHLSAEQKAERDRYEQQLRRLHEERQYEQRRGAEQPAFKSSRPW